MLIISLTGENSKLLVIFLLVRSFTLLFEREWVFPKRMLISIRDTFWTSLLQYWIPWGGGGGGLSYAEILEARRLTKGY